MLYIDLLSMYIFQIELLLTLVLSFWNKYFESSREKPKTTFFCKWHTMAVQILTTVENSLLSICENYGLNNLIRQPAFYKNPCNPVCIDLILTNVPRSFQSTCVVETGLSDFHLMTLTVMRKSLRNISLK